VGSGAITTDDGEARGRRERGTARAAHPPDESLVGVPQTGDLVGLSGGVIGLYAVARMAPGEFERFVSALRNGGAADAAALAPAERRGRRMSDPARGRSGSPAGPAD
jgi:hypothetical protein